MTMLQPTFIDNKTQYAQAVKGPTEPTESLQPQRPNILGIISADDEIQKLMINRQWEYLKVSIKKFRTPRTLVQLADVHFYKKNFERARDYYIAAIKEDKHYLLAYDRLIFCLATLKDNKRIDEYYNKWLEVSNRDPKILHNYILFKIFYYEKNEKMADDLLEELEEVINKNEKNFAAIDTKGFICLNIKNDISTAKKYFTKALNLNPSYVHSINSLGTCYLREKNIKAAIEMFNKVLSIDDNYFPAYENLASSYSQLDDKKSELEILQKAAAKKVELSKDWEHKVGWLMIQIGDLNNAITWYENKIDDEPNNNLLYNNLGLCYLKKGDIEKARSYFEKAISLFKSGKGVNDQRSLLSFYNLSRTCLDMDDDEGLEVVMKDIHKLDHNDNFLKYLKGVVALRKKDYSSARGFFDEVLSKTLDIPEVYPDYGFILECIDRDYKEAIGMLLQGLKRGFINLVSLNNLAYAYIRLGKLDEASKVLKGIKGPLTGELNATKGMLEIRKGELEKGNGSYSKAISMLKRKESKLQAEQIWRYEQSLYYFAKGKIKESKRFLEKAKELGESYLNIDIAELEEKLN